MLLIKKGVRNLCRENVGRVVARAPDGRRIIEYWFDNHWNLGYECVGLWDPLKYVMDEADQCFQVEAKFDEYGVWFYLYNAAGTNCMVGGLENVHFINAPCDFEYVLNLNPDDPYPLGKMPGWYWDGQEWYGEGKVSSLNWDDKDNHIIIPYSEVLDVLGAFKAKF